jgi:hypothetical protein
MFRSSATISLLSGQPRAIKIEIGLREPLLTPAFDGACTNRSARSRVGPTNGPAVAVRCISRMEAFAEKFPGGAVTSRGRRSAIFYDIDYAVRRLDLRPQDPTWSNWSDRSWLWPATNLPMSPGPSGGVLRRQLDAQLKPVLRDRDFAEFDLERAFRTVARMGREDPLSRRIPVAGPRPILSRNVGVVRNCAQESL